MNPHNQLNPKLCDLMRRDADRGLTEIVIPAVNAEKGNLAAAARRLSISSSTMLNWSQKMPRLRQAIVDARVRALCGEAG